VAFEASATRRVACRALTTKASKDNKRETAGITKVIVLCGGECVA